MCERRSINDNKDEATLHRTGSDFNVKNSDSQVDNATLSGRTSIEASTESKKSSITDLEKRKTSQAQKGADQASNQVTNEWAPFNMVISYATYQQWLELESRAFEARYYRQPQTRQSKKYNIMRLLGQGGFGVVLLVNVEKGGTLYAMKVMAKEQIKERRVIAYVIGERRALSAVHHPLILSLIESLKDNSNVYLVMPFIECGNLLQLMRSTTFRRFSYEEAKFYFAQVVLVLEYLHKMRIVYRDLKPENLMLDMSGYIKLTDFGFAKLLDAKRERTYSTLGTPAYMAPEVFGASNCGYSFGVDWWTAGCLLYEFMVGFSPFSTVDGSVVSIIRKVMTSELQFPSVIKPDAKHLVCNLCQKNPHHRLGCQKEGAAAVRGHPFFQDMNFICLFNKQLPTPHAVTSKYDKLYYTGQQVPNNIVTVNGHMQLKKEFAEF